MLANDNHAEYRHPELYDLENPDFEPEGLFYLSLAQALGGLVLELGCGTGRMTIPMAQRGIEMVGLDVVPEMLAVAREKASAAGAPPIQWVEADVRDFHLGRTFNLIFEAGSVFMHMLTNADQQALLARVREHLAPQGRFVLGLFFPHLGYLETVADEKEWFTYQDQQGRTVRVSGTEAYDELRQVKLETAYRRIANLDGSETLVVAPLCLRQTFPQEMEMLLDLSGFVVLERYGGQDRSPLTNESQLQVYVCGLK